MRYAGSLNKLNSAGSGTVNEARSMQAHNCRSSFPAILQRMYNHGKSLSETLLSITSATAAANQLSALLITTTDPAEYAETLMTKAFAVVNVDSPEINKDVRLEQQSTQAEVTADCLQFNQAFLLCSPSFSPAPAAGAESNRDTNLLSSRH